MSRAKRKKLTIREKMEKETPMIKKEVEKGLKDIIVSPKKVAESIEENGLRYTLETNVGFRGLFRALPPDSKLRSNILKLGERYR